MKTITKLRNWWKRPLAFILLLALVASSFSMAVVPERVQAAEPIKWLTYKFDINDFSNPSLQQLFQLNGNSTILDGKLMVTEKKASQTGSVFNKQSFQPHEEFSFSTGFSFRIDGNPPNTADGMTFAIVGDPTKLGLYGGHLGLAGVKPSLGIKFDTYQNNSSSAVYKDPSNNYIGIAYNGNLVNDNPSWYKNLNDVTDESGNPKFVLANGNTYYAWIDYDGASSNVKVYLNDSASKPSDPLIDANGINLKQIFGDANGIYAGFTGSTSSWFESHEVLSWYFVNDFAPIQDNFGTPEGSSDYQQAPSSIDMTVEKSDNPGKHKVVVTAYNPDGSAATEVPITLTNSKEGSWTDTDGNPITDWSVVKTDSEGKVTVYFTPDNALDATDVRAVAVGGAIATGTISAVAPTPQDVTLEKVETGTNEIVITFDQEIATGAATDGFVVTAGDQQEVVEISEIVVEGNRVTLKLSKELKPNDIVNLKYTKPLEGNLKGKNGAFVLDFEKEVKNNLIELPTSSDFYVSSIYGDDATGDGTRDKPYATLNKAYAEVNNGGTIYILDNITLTGGVDVVVGINEAKHITISTAPNVENTTVIKRGQPSGKVLFQLTNNSQLTLRNIIIDGNLEGGAIDGRLFNVYSGSKLIIDEGAILENSYSQHIGSAIYINNSTNTGTVVEMIGGEIRGNKSLKAPGGAVAVDSGAFIMTGGLITDNTGGGVQSRGGQISLSGEASITGNTTSGKEMNVYLANHKTLNLAGAFTGEAGITTDSMVPGAEFGQATEEGLGSIENLIADSGALLAGYDDVKKVLVWRLFKNELSQPSKDDEIIGKRPTLKGVTEPNATVTIKIVSAKDPSLDITKEVTADANGNWVLAVSETLETGKYTTQVTAKKNKTQSEPVTRSFEIVDNVYVSSGGNDTTGDGTPRNPYATLKKAYAEVKDGGTIYLLDDITVLPDATGKMIDLNSDKRVTITTATGVDETAVIRRGQPNGQINTIFGLTKGELTLKNIIIDGNFEGKEINGRLFNVYGGSKLIIEEGSILQNSFSQHPGSAIHITTGSVVEMKGGEIRGNKRASTGAAVAVDSGAKFYMTGGLITDNIGGGVQSRGTNGGEIYLSGEARITGNTDSGKGKNVNLENNKTLILNGAFTGEAGITTQNMVPGTQFGRVTEDGLGSIENLIADYGPLLASYDQNNVLVWRLFKNELSQPSTDGEITGTNPTLSGVTEPFAKVTIKIVSADDPSFVINEERTADENGNWELPIDNALNIGAYTITVTANKNKTQSNPVTRQFEVVDKTSLQAKFDEITAENLVETEYTEASWTALDEAMKKAEEVLGNPAATQAEVDKALEDLEQARTALTKKPVDNTVDKTLLEAKFDEITAENLVETEYTEASWTALDEAMKKAEEVLDNPAATQAEVDKALEDLEQARTALTKKPVGTVDKTALEAKVAEITAENLVETEYTEASWKALQEAMDAAKDVLDNPAATQEEVNAALTALTKAREVLKKPSQPTPTVDKSKLQAKTEQINSENLVADDYTSESWEELQQALQKAETVLKDPNATQEEVDAALTALTKTREGLKKSDQPTPTVDKTKLQAKVDEIAAENLDEDDYTKDSWRELEKALEKAEAVLTDPNSTQKEVDAALSALKKAREGLKKPGEPTVDKSKLEAKVDEIVDEDLDEDDYTGSSWRKLEKALKQAKDVLADPDATQDEVDEALAGLKKARRDLTSADKQGSGRDKNRDRDKGDAYNVSNPFFSEDGSSVGQQKPSEPAKSEEKNDYTGYMNGYPTGKFDPNRQVTRAEMAMILANTGMINPETSAKGTFFDVDNGHWASDAIKRANEAGLMNGYANGTFNPQGGITRAEMATIVYKYLGLTGDGMPNNFYDVPADHWATQIIAAVSESGLMNGYPDGTFHPQKTLTRAETVTIINRLTNKIQLSPVNGQSWPDVPPTHWAYKDIEAATKK